MVLSRELGWTSVRDEMFYGDLDAAQSISGIAFALGMGFSELRREVAVPLILNLHGNASKHYIVEPFAKRGELAEGILRFAWLSLKLVAQG